MKKALSLFVVFALVFSLTAFPAMAHQSADYSDYYNRIEMFDPEFESRDYIEEIVYNLTTKFGIRRMGSQNEYNSVKYIESEFLKLGYTDVVVGEFTLTNSIAMGTLRFDDGGPDIHGNTSTTAYDFSGAKLVDVGTHLNYSIPAGTTGDVVIAVLFDNAAVAVATVNTVVTNLRNANPDVTIRGVVTARSGAMHDRRDSFGNVTWRNSNERTVPAAISPSSSLPAITLPMAYYIQAVERADAFDNMHRHNRVGSANTLNNSSWSVFAVKPASTPDPDLVIVCTAHIDTVLASIGASDNAASVASVMENARLFVGQDTGNIELIFAALGAEEGSAPSFAGSAWVADQMIARYGAGRVINLNNDMGGSPNQTSGNSPVNIDMINVHNALGGTGANTVFGTVRHNLPAWLILSNADDVEMAPGITNYRLNRFGSTDHVAFENRNMDGVNLAFTSPAVAVEAEYHTSEDTMKNNWSWERNKNISAMLTAGIDKAVAVQTSKIAKFQTKESDSGLDVFLFEAERQFKTYAMGIQARFTNVETGARFDLVFTPEETMHSLPAGIYTVSNVIGTGQGVADHVTRQELLFSANMMGRIAEYVVSETTRADFISIVETSKNSRAWVLSFWVTQHFSDGSTRVVKEEVVLNGNNANLDGKVALDSGYTLVFDIKGNGSNIKALELI